MATKKKSEQTVLYKVLTDGCSPIGTLEWSLPTKDKPGDWHEVAGDLVQCKNGLHLTSDPQRRWSGSQQECYLVETEGELLHLPDWQDEYVARKVRLLRRLTWAELGALGINDGSSRKAASRKAQRAPKPPTGPSAALQFVACAWNNRCGATQESWLLVNSTMHAALNLAIEGGMSFNEGDFGEIYDRMRGRFWFHEGEGFYAAAVAAGNIQACRSYETWAGRKPFLWEGKRLYIGSDLLWEGQAVRVTSFGDGSLIACAYDRDVNGYGRKVARRFTITHEELARAEKDRKVEASIAQDVKALQGLLREAKLTVSGETLTGWTPAQREEAMEWARIARLDARKTRVKPEPPPTHLTDAVENAAKHERLAEIKEIETRLREAEKESLRAQKLAERCRKALAELRAEEGTGHGV